jgi:hypothetical protein
VKGTGPGVWFGVVAALLIVAYLVYRFSFTVRSVQARRQGDRDRADSLQTRGTLVFLGTAGALTLVLLVWMVFLIATH